MLHVDAGAAGAEPAPAPAAGHDDSDAVSLSSATGLPLLRCIELLDGARGDFNLAISRGFKERHAAAATTAEGTGSAEDAVGTRSKATVRSAHSCNAALSFVLGTGGLTDTRD